MAFTLEQITTGVRQALYGREVREWIAQMGEWVYRWVGEQTATVQRALTTMKTLEEQARTSKTSAADSAAKAQQAYKDAAAEKTKAVTAIATEKQTSLDAITAAKTTALADVNRSTETAAAAARTAALKAESAETSSNLAKTAKENAQGSASAARASEDASKGYLDQIKVIANGAQGWYATPMALQNAVPSGQNGWWAIVGSTDTIWVWDSDSGAWAESGGTVDLSGYYTKNDVDTKLAGKSDTDHTHAYLPTSGGTMSGNIGFSSIGDTNTSSKISWSGSTDGADIYYQTMSKDQGNLVLNLRDDVNCYLRIASNGTFKSYFSPNDGNFHGNVDGTASASNSVNGFTFAAQTSDPGAGSSLATNKILLVYK